MSFSSFTRPVLLGSVLASALSAIVIVGCSGDDEPDGSPTPNQDGGPATSVGATEPGALDVKPFAAAYCVRLERCSPLSFKSAFRNVEHCSTKLAESRQSRYTSNGSAITNAMLGACTAKLKSASCDDAAEEAAECQFTGKLANGGACVYSLQCSSGSCRATASDAGPEGCGTCWPQVGAGESCSAATCKGDLLCGPDKKCIAMTRVAEGAACDHAKGIYCSSGLGCLQKKCVRPLAENAACQSGGIPCGSGLSCWAGKCASYKFANVGEACNSDSAAGPRVVCQASWCNSTTKKCEASSEEGGACNSKTGPDCAYPLGCKDAKCVRAAVPACK